MTESEYQQSQYHQAVMTHTHGLLNDSIAQYAHETLLAMVWADLQTKGMDDVRSFANLSPEMKKHVLSVTANTLKHTGWLDPSNLGYRWQFYVSPVTKQEDFLMIPIYDHQLRRLPRFVQFQCAPVYSNEKVNVDNITHTLSHQRFDEHSRGKFIGGYSFVQFEHCHYFASMTVNECNAAIQAWEDKVLGNSAKIPNILSMIISLRMQKMMHDQYLFDPRKDSLCKFELQVADKFAQYDQMTQYQAHNSEIGYGIHVNENKTDELIMRQGQPLTPTTEIPHVNQHDYQTQLPPSHQGNRLHTG